MPQGAGSNTASQLAAAQALWSQGDSGSAESVLLGVREAYPADEETAVLLAKIMQSQGRLDAATAVIFDSCRQGGFAPEQSLRGAQFIQNCQRQSLAAELCNATIARGNATAAIFALAGHVSRELGDFAAARQHYLTALDRGVDLQTWYVLGALAGTLRYADAGHPDFERLAAHFADSTFSARARAASGFGLAKAHDDVGAYREAAKVLVEANALVHGVQPWSPSDWRAFVGARRGEQMARARHAAGTEFIPVFIVGLPRTGTTLTATRLAQQIGARDRGELRVMRFIAERLISGMHLRDGGALDEAADLYRAHARQDDPPATVYIDQDPLNFRYLHVIAALFPQARIIHCVRDRRDTALSLWSQDFAHADCAFAYDFADICAYAQGHDDLMRHWARSLPLPIHTLPYEDLVAAPQAAISALCRSADLPESDVPEAGDGAPITSASQWQARQPIYATSVGRWRAYADYVPELMQFPTTT